MNRFLRFGAILVLLALLLAPAGCAGPSEEQTAAPQVETLEAQVQMLLQEAVDAVRELLEPLLHAS